jgi:hypothetical protein
MIKWLCMMKLQLYVNPWRLYVIIRMRAKRDEIVAVFKWRLYVMKRWMYVMVLGTSHKFVAMYDKMVAVCN